MKHKYEYKFVRLSGGLFGPKREARDNYQEEVHKYAREGWRLVQIFAPAIAGYGSAKYYELVLEREIQG